MYLIAVIILHRNLREFNYLASCLLFYWSYNSAAAMVPTLEHVSSSKETDELIKRKLHSSLYCCSSDVCQLVVPRFAHSTSGTSAAISGTFTCRHNRNIIRKFVICHQPKLGSTIFPLFGDGNIHKLFTIRN